MILKNTAKGPRLILMKDGSYERLMPGESRDIEGDVAKIPHGVAGEDEIEDSAAAADDISKMNTEQLQARMAELGIEESSITGTGAGDKVINKDRVTAIEAKMAEDASTE